MNKGVLIANIQKIMTNIQQTIEDLTSMISKEKCYSKKQFEKYVDLLSVKIQDDDNYKSISTEFSNLSLLLKRLQSERITLKKLIADVEFDIYSLGSQVEDKKTFKSEQQREYEILADSLNISDNDEQIYSIMKDKEIKINEIQKQIDEILKEIDNKKYSLDQYNREVKSIETKENVYLNDLNNLNNYTIDENDKNRDINTLNILNKLINVLDTMDSLIEINNILEYLIDYLGSREASKNIVDEKIAYIKTIVAKINGVMLEFIGAINLDECFSVKETIISKLNDKNSYLLNEKERRERSLEISNLEFDISLCQSECVSDEQTLIDYSHRIDKINDSIEKINFQNSLLQGKIDDLNLKKAYFIKENSQIQTEEINKEIKRKQKKVDSNKKYIEKLIKFKIDIENAIKSIKKTIKNSETLKNDMQLVLREKKEMPFSLNKYNLDDDKKQLLIIDFIIEMNNFANGLLKQNYLKKLDEVEVESYDPLVAVIGFYDYDNFKQLIDDEFVAKAKNAMEAMINVGNMSYINNRFIRTLNLQGLKVTRYGKALRTMEKQAEDVKMKFLDGDYNGK